MVGNKQINIPLNPDIWNAFRFCVLGNHRLIHECAEEALIEWITKNPVEKNGRKYNYEFVRSARYSGKLLQAQDEINAVNDLLVVGNWKAAKLRLNDLLKSNSFNVEQMDFVKGLQEKIAVLEEEAPKDDKLMKVKAKHGFSGPQTCSFCGKVPSLSTVFKDSGNVFCDLVCFDLWNAKRNVVVVGD